MVARKHDDETMKKALAGKSVEAAARELGMHPRTLAAPDSHASRGGWISGRDAKVITYHAEHGEVGRITVSADMLKGEAA